ncbi:MAG: sec-independent protein translocase protein TatA [Gaiellaceae bacterium]|jgi:sec-independent protein translocase protein TatA|nr:sec-independent protein translocase protein TatA [Gaiellaceae bacterium]
MPGFIGFPEILLLGVVVLLIFGPKRLPEMGRSLGHGFREFKDSVTGSHDKQLDDDAQAIAEPVSFEHLEPVEGKQNAA